MNNFEWLYAHDPKFRENVNARAALAMDYEHGDSDSMGYWLFAEYGGDTQEKLDRDVEEWVADGSWQGYSLDDMLGSVMRFLRRQRDVDRDASAAMAGIGGAPSRLESLHDWHRPMGDNPHADVVLTSLPPKWGWYCSRCCEVAYTLVGERPDERGCTA